MVDPQWEFAQKILGLNDGSLLEITPAGTLTASQALDVYQTGYQVRLVDSLRETYSAVAHCVGGESFKSLALEFIEKNPSRFYNLSHYGEGFGKFLRAHDNLKSFPFLGELAEFEWEFCHLFHAALEQCGEVDLAKTSSGKDFKIQFVPHLRVFRYDYGIINLWHGYTHSSDDLPAWKTPQNLILYRSGMDLRLREINLSEYFLLHFLMQSESLNGAFERLDGLGLKLTESRVSEIFSFLMAEGLIKCIAE